MSILQYFSTRIEKQIAEQMAEKLAKSIPPSNIESKSKILSVNKVTRQIEDTLQLAVLHQQQHHPGFIKRAILANTFKWSLANKGYSDEFVNIATEALIMETTKATQLKAKGTIKP